MAKSQEIASGLPAYIQGSWYLVRASRGCDVAVPIFVYIHALYLLIPYAFAPIHSFRGSATNVRFSPRARQPWEFQHCLHRVRDIAAMSFWHQTVGLVLAWLVAVSHLLKWIRDRLSSVSEIVVWLQETISHSNIASSVEHRGFNHSWLLPPPSGKLKFS
jgi:hypothetical protein